MKSRTFGLGGRLHFLGKGGLLAYDLLRRNRHNTVRDYRDNRENGSDIDSPNWPFPEDGKYDWVKETKVAQWLDEPSKKGWYRARYTEGPKDKAWMEEKDLSYLARLKREEQQKKEEQMREQQQAFEQQKQQAEQIRWEQEERYKRQEIELKLQQQQALLLQQQQTFEQQEQQTSSTSTSQEASTSTTSQSKPAAPPTRRHGMGLSIIKSQTFGLSSSSQCYGRSRFSGLPRLVSQRTVGAPRPDEAEALVDYNDSRENGTAADSPGRPFPNDGKYDWVEEAKVTQWLDKPARKKYYRVRYREGPKDRAWMEEKDRNYLARLKREEQQKKEEQERLPQQQEKKKREASQKQQQAEQLEKQRLEREKREIEQEKLALQKEQAKLSQERKSFEQQKQQTSSTSTSQEASTSTTSQSKPAAPSARRHGMGLSASLRIKSSTLTTSRQIGEGAYGRVYLGTLHKHTEVAIKELKVTGLPETIQQDFKTEAKVMANLRSPRIVLLYGVCFKAPYRLVMEYLPKGSLFDVLHSKQDLSWSMRIRIAQDMGEGLHFLHVQTPMIVHRDLKSLNVLLDEHSRAKLTDFGLAQVKQVITSMSKQQSKANQSVGTLAWMAPELFARKPSYTAASDVYAYGMVMWELASRQIPFHEAADASLIPIWVKDGDREDIPAETPPAFAALIAQCWDGRREQRPGVSEVISELKNIGTEQPSGDSASAQTSTSQSGPQYDAGTASTTSGSHYASNLNLRS